MKPTKETTVATTPRLRFDVCRKPGCGLEVESRGLCHTHYRVARGLIADSEGLTWEVFERHGKSVPPKRDSKTWFLDFVGH